MSASQPEFMAQNAREENERLKERIAELEAAIVKGLAGKGK